MSAPRWKFAAMVQGCLLLALVPASVPASAKGPEPPQRIPLMELGFQPPPQNAIASAGGNLSTVHFVDETHLLVTFNVRSLMKRMVDCPPEDMDRTVEAVIVELPSGKPVARTRWRIHDSGQYLWELGRGRFLVRVRNSLKTIAPGVGIGRQEVFGEQPLLESKRTIAAVLLSAEHDLLTVETTEMPARGENGELLARSGQPPMQLNFYRLVEPETPGAKLILQSAGLANSRGPVALSLSSAGYLEILQESTKRWLFDFDSYAGPFVELSPFDTTCRPRPVFVSASEFVAFGCRGSEDRLSLGGFSLRGDQMWQQDFSDAHAFPNFAFAPAAGRFALSRNIVSSNAGMTVEFAPSAFTTQEIRVYQTYNGKQLLQVQATPVQHTGGNYDLSPEGLRFAVLQENQVVVYRLPGLSKADEAEVRKARALAPGPVEEAVRLVPHPRPGGVKVGAIQPAVQGGGVQGSAPRAEATKAALAPAPPASAPLLVGATPAVVAPAPPSEVGPVAAEPRKVPSLYPDPPPPDPHAPEKNFL